MELSYNMTWFKFLVILIVLLAVAMLYEFFFKRYIHSALRKLNYPNTQVYFTVFNRIVKIAMIIYIMICFMLINPIVHGIIVILLGAYLYSFMSNYIYGSLMIAELKLKEGMQLELTSRKLATISSLEASSIVLQHDGKTSRLAYAEIIQREGLNIKTNSAKQFSLIVRAKEESTFEKNKNLLQARLFQHPHIDDTKRVKIQRSGEEIEVVFSVLDQKYQQNIVQTIDKAGFIIQSLN